VIRLRAAADLAAETRAMHHCVASSWRSALQATPRSGRGGAPQGNTTRLLTIELDRQYRAIQVRGFANRTTRPEERKLLERQGARDRPPIATSRRGCTRGSCRGLRAGAEIVVIHKLPGTEIGLQRGAG
jgi:hypothetical protein